MLDDDRVIYRALLHLIFADTAASWALCEDSTLWQQAENKAPRIEQSSSREDYHMYGSSAGGALDF